MKKFLVVLLALAMVFGLGSVAFAADTQIADYTDLAGVPAEQQAAIYRLTALGVLAGDGIGGDFRPEDTITRAEFAKIAIYLAGKADAVDLYASFAPAFADVQDGTWYEGYVNAAVAFGYMKGYADDTFKPGQTVTMQEVATVLLRIAGYTDALKGEWPNDYIRKANDTEIIAYVDFVGPRAATRAEVASIANETLDRYMVAEVENEVAAGLGFVDGTVDEDGFTYIEDKTNEGMTIDQGRYDYNFVTVLEYAFDARVATEFDYFAFNTAFVESSAWKFADYNKGELELLEADDIDWNEAADKEWKVASDYYIFGAGLFDLAWHQAKVTVNDENEILFVEITSERIVVDKYDEADDDFDGAYDTTKMDTDNGDGQIGLVDEAYGYLWVGDIDADDKDEAYGFIGMEKYADASGVDAIWNIVAEVEVDDEDVTVTLELDNAIDLDYDTEDELLLFIKDGEFITVEDLEDDDVVTYVGNVEDDKDCFVGYDNTKGLYELFVVTSPVEGEMNKLYSNDKEEIKIDDVVYFYGDGQYSKDNGDVYTAADYDKLYAGDLEEILYVPAYAWKEVATIIADIDETSTDYYAIVLGYEAGRKVVDTDKEFVDYEEEIEAIIVMNAEGEEVTLPFAEDAADILAALDATMVWDSINDQFPEPGDGVKVYVNEDGELTALELFAPYNGKAVEDNAGFIETFLADKAVILSGDLKAKASGRVQLTTGGDWYTIDENTKIAGVYSDEDCDKTDAHTDTVNDPHYAWDCFEKAEVIAVDDVLGKTIKYDYAFAEVKGRHVEYLYIVDPSVDGAKGDITLGIAEEHYQSKKAEYIALIDGTELLINEDAEAKFYDQLEDSSLYPFVALYCLDGGELTDIYADDQETTGNQVVDKIGKGEIALLFDETGVVAAYAETLIDEYFDDEDNKYDLDTEFIPTAWDKDMEDLTDGTDTYYFGDLEIVDLTDEDCDTLTAKQALRKITEGKEDNNNQDKYKLIVVTYDTDEAILAYLTLK